MTLIGEPLWVRLFTTAVIIAWVAAWFRLFWYWKKPQEDTDENTGTD